MKTRDTKLSPGAVTLAAWGVLCGTAVPFAALADSTSDFAVSATSETSSEDVNALIYPTNHVDVGVLGVTSDSTKYGEYNGLNDSGPYAIGNVDIKGGDAYGKGAGTLHWELHGTDLGTTSRAADGSVGNQGVWSLGFSFDQLRHYTTTGYQTPYLGGMGDNTFTLLPSFGVVNTQAAGANGTGTNTLTANQLKSFHTEDVYTERTNTGIKGGYNFNPQWGVQFSYNHLDQSGAKLIGAATDNSDFRPAGFRYRAEGIVILMNPTQYQTDTFSAGINWLGKRAHLSLSYDGSFFHDDYSGVTFSNPLVRNGPPSPATGASPGAAFPLNTMSTAPSNEFHQLNLDGGFSFSPATKLAGKFSIGRNTQDDSFAGTFTPGTADYASAPLPASSLDGVVVTTHADLRLTHQATRNLALTLGAKYDERDNQTASYTYKFKDLGGDEQTVVNTPMSNRRYQAAAAGDYRIDNRQRLHLGYQFDEIERSCNNALANNAQGAGPAAYYTTASCVQVPKNQEHTFELGYRIKPMDLLQLHAGYRYSHRNADVNSSFYNPMQANSQGYENFGYLAFFDASRNEHQFKAGANWEATDRLSIGVSGKYAKDSYGSTLGVQKGDAASANLDISYSFSEKNSVGAYASWQMRSRDLLTAHARDPLSPPAELWTNNLKDEDALLGLTARQKGLLGSKLVLVEDLTYSIAKSKYSTALLYANPAVGVDGDSPTIRSETLRFKLTGTYQVNKSSSLVMGYSFQWLKSNDYYYNAYQYGFTPSTVLPTNQVAPNYTDHAIFLAYRYSFR